MSAIGSLTGGSSGSITGQLDVQWIVEQIIYAKQQPIRDLETYEIYYEEKKKAFQELNTRVSALESALYKMNFNSFETKSAALSRDEYMSASASASASNGDYNIVIKQLAAAQSDSSTGFSSADNQVLSNGVFTIKNADGTEVLGEIDYTGSTLSLNDLKSRINSLNLDISATVINFGTSAIPDYHLQVTSDSTGTENGFTIVETNGGGGTLAGMTTKTAAKDAQIFVNTDPAAHPTDYITRSSNTIKDVINGVTLNLKKAAASVTLSEATQITVSSDNEGLKENIQDFVDAFNNAIEYLNEQFTFDEQKQRSGVLSGESAAVKVKMDLLSIASSRVEGVNSSESYKTLAMMGIELNKEGKLEIDDDKLDDALESHMDAVKRLLKNVGSTTHSDVGYIGSTKDTTAGEYTVHVSTIAEQAKTQGTENIAANLGQDETLTITFAGKSYNVSLTEDMTQSEVVSAINTEMDKQSAAVYAQVSGGKLQLISDDYGSAASVSVVSDIAAAGGGTGIGTTTISDSGQDVGGYFKNSSGTTYTAAGSGRILTGSTGLTKGLSTSISTTSLADPINGDDKGTVYFTRGVGETLRKRMYETSFPYTGLLASNIQSLDDKLDGISTKISDINRNLAIEEDLLITQFSRANEALAQMSYLQSTISNNFS